MAMFVALAAGAAARAAPAPSVADCVWSQVPQADRHKVISASASTDDLTKQLQDLIPAVLPRITANCHIVLTSDSETQVGVDLSTKLMETWAAAQIKARYGVAPAALSVAWKRIPAPLRGQIADGAKAGTNPTPDQISALVGMAGAVGLKGQDALTMIGIYAASRAMFEQAGGTG
jgi:hypothetical protein